MNAPALRFERGDVPVLDGVWMAIARREPSGMALRPVGAGAGERFFSNEELLDFYVARRLTILRGASNDGKGPRPVASYSERWQREMHRRLEYVRACERYFDPDRAERRRYVFSRTVDAPPGDMAADWAAYVASKPAEKPGFVYLRTYWRIAQIVMRYRRMAKDRKGLAPLRDREYVGASTLRTWHRAWCRTKVEVDLVPKHEHKLGKPRLDPAITQIIATKVRERWLTLERPPVSIIHHLVCAEILTKKADGVLASDTPFPSHMAVHRWIKANVDEWERLDRRHGRKKANEKRGSAYLKPEVERPLQVVEMDNTQLDILVVLERGGKRVVDRPWLTLAIDACTRMVVGYHIGLADPSWASVMAALSMGMQEKRRDKGDLYESAWPVMGVPEILLVDNGKDFKSDAMKAAAADLHIDLRYTPPRTPQMKGKVERFFSEVADDYCALICGRTFNNVVVRGDYSAVDRAEVSLESVKRLFKLWVVDIYHNRAHDGLRGVTPLQRWGQVAHHGVRVPPSIDDLKFILGLPFKRTIQPSGVRLFGLRYKSIEVDDIATRVSGEVDVRVDTHDVTRILVLDPKKHKWLEAKCTDAFAKGLSLAEWKAVRDLAQKIPPDERRHAYETLLRAREIFDESVRGAKRQQQASPLEGGKFYDDPSFYDADPIDNDLSRAADTPEPEQAPSEPEPLSENASPLVRRNRTKK